MQARTIRYLGGRFADYYGQADLSMPPNPERREWGHIPWKQGSTRMIRHHSLLEMGDINRYLHEQAPQHVYFSAAYYENPAMSSMEEKGWEGADLIFDLDADHLPAINPEKTSYSDMLAACKQELTNLLSFIERDFNFSDIEIVFSGSRGYHVHVRDMDVQHLDSSARRELVDYIRGINLKTESVIYTQSSGGTNRRALRQHGGWGRRVHQKLVEFGQKLQSLSEREAIDRLQAIDKIGDKRARKLYTQFTTNFDQMTSGNIEVGGQGMRYLITHLTNEATKAQTAPIDEPVTTDTRRLIRLPGSLHGGSGLVVRRLSRDAINSFDPLSDAIADRFRSESIQVNITEPGDIEFDGDMFTIDAGIQSVDESLGIFLMTRGRAEKVSE
ncbi:MAG: DNA primase, eukaryotic-type, small subunit, putative [Haloquadratum sp. J07HQX50]|jgi:DNA primase small subunit (EC 2.7.7.-)|nr:MAG: DNA primase, eukaryotic-type, small subunit, putative [Haloquadratum sp. J07HQX50]